MKKSIMQQTIRLFVLLALFCISAEQAWALKGGYAISTGTVEGGTLQFYSTAECDGDEINSIESGKTVYIKATPESGYSLVGFTAANITVVRAGDTGAAESRRNAATDGPEVGGKVAVSAENATNGIYKFTMTAKDVVVSATFPPNMPITITADNGSKTYDGTPMTKTTFTVSGQAQGDTHKFTVTMTAASTITNVGSTPNVIATVDGVPVTPGKQTRVGNYLVTTQSGTLTVGKKTVTVASGITVSQKVYNGTTTASVSCGGAKFSGKVSGDILSISGVTGTFDTKDVGTGKTVTLNYTNAKLGGASADNYQLATSGNQASTKANITKKAVTVTGGISVSNKVYDGTTTATTDCSGATLSGTVSGENLTIGDVTGTFDSKNVGMGKTVTLNYSNAKLGGTSATNYQLATTGNQASTTANITKQTVTVTGGITVSDKVYDGTKTADVSCGGATLSGKVSGDELTIGGVTGTFSDKKVGTDKTVTLNYSNAKLGGESADNYQLATSGNQASTTASITKKAVTVTGGISVSNKVYDGTTTATTDCSGATLSGTVSGENLTIGDVTGTFDSKNVGMGKTVTLNYSNAKLGGTSATNYQLATTGNQASTTANITKQTVTVTGGITVSDKVYDGTKTATTDCSGATFSGKVSGDDLTISDVTGTFSNKRVGTSKTVTLNFSNASLYGTDAANYKLAGTGNQATAKADITKATLTVTANAKTISYGDDADNNGVTYSGFVSGEGESVLNNAPVYEYNTEADGSGDDYVAGSPVGVYYIIPSGLSSNNYAIIYKTGVLTVEEKDIDYAGGTITQDENGYNVSLTEGTGSANPLSLDEDDELANLTYSRTLKAPGESEGDKTIDGKAAKLYTVCLPFEPLTGEAVRYYTLSSVKGTVLDFEEVVTPVANTPYLVAVFGNANFTENCTDVDVTSTAINSTTADGYTLKGTFTGLSNAKAAGKYILQDGSKWGQVPAENTAVYIPPFRAYIEGPSNDAREMSSSFGENATSINALRLVGNDGTERWYDLQGRRIEQPTKKGIYINNGKKIKR